MFITTISGVTEQQDIQITRSCKAIVIKSETNPILRDVSATYKVISANGNKNIVDDYPVLHLSEIYTQDDGLYIANSKGAHQQFNGAESICFLPVASGGAYSLKNGEYISLDLEGLTAATTYKVYSLESADLDGLLYDIDKAAVNAPRIEQRFESDVDTLILPEAGLDRVQIIFPDGVDVNYTVDELIAESVLGNDLICVSSNPASVPIYGYAEMFMLDLGSAIAYQIHCKGDAGYAFSTIKFKE